MKHIDWQSPPPSKKEEERLWAISVLTRCRDGEIERDSKEFRKASKIMGPVITSRIVDQTLATCKPPRSTGSLNDAMCYRMPGSYAHGKRSR